MFFRLQETVEETVPVSGSSGGVNALGLVVFSMCFGLVIGNMKQQGQALREFFDCLNEAIMRLVAVIIWSVRTHILCRLLLVFCACMSNILCVSMSCAGLIDLLDTEG